MKVVEKEFGQLPDGKIVTAFTLENTNHTQITAISYGATWQSFSVERDGEKQELLVQFDDLAAYLDNPFHFGNTIGRVGGRLSKTEYTLNGTQFTLTPNDHGNVLHSGINGFDAVNWHGEAHHMETAAEVIFTRTFDDEFAGQLDAQVTYRLDDEDRLEIIFSGVSTENTLFNPMTHVYFNLVGKNKDISQHKLQIASRQHLEVNHDTIPTGKLIDNQFTKFDFAHLHALGQEHYDDAWVCDPDRQGVSVGLTSPDETVTLTVDSDRNGVVIFTANPDDSSSIKTALAIEMQTLPDAVNHEGFGDIVLPANDTKTYTVTYQIKKSEDK
ncbi:aldose epimerase family protein [Leuconostoc inhae]|uniref:aldose epimerase family protein n=1 Tax=Leuconostoc inhae TaxID=178001 RepID=UPI001C7D9E8C|nr:aldose epimerase family protein [Leuconostoc inhae]